MQSNYIVDMAHLLLNSYIFIKQNDAKMMVYNQIIIPKKSDNNYLSNICINIYLDNFFSWNAKQDSLT